MDATIIRDADIASAVRRAVTDAGGFSLPKTDATVLVKPNCNVGMPPPASTNPIVVRETIRLLKESGAGRIIVGDRSWVRFFIPRQKNTIANMKKNGILEVAQDEGAEAIGFEEDGWFRVKPDKAEHWRGSIRLTKVLKAVDYHVTLPVLKTHSITDFTLSLKNAVGLLHTSDRLRLHSSNIQEKTAEINLACPTDMAIIDGSFAFIDGGPSSGTAVTPNLIIASPSRVKADILGYDTLRELGADLPNARAVEHPMISRAIAIGIDDGV